MSYRHNRILARKDGYEGSGRISMIECVLLLNRLRKALGLSLTEVAIIAVLVVSLGILALPGCPMSPQRRDEAVLKVNLRALREAADSYHQDLGRYPSSLEVLVGESYLRQVPVDPMTGSSQTWRLILDAGSPEPLRKGGSRP